MYINFPKYNLQQIKALFSAWKSVTSQFKTPAELDNFVAQTLYSQIQLLIEDEFHFLEQLCDVLRRTVSGKALSDSQKHIFSIEFPFDIEHEHADLALSFKSAHSAYDATEESKIEINIEDSSEV